MKKVKMLFGALLISLALLTVSRAEFVYPEDEEYQNKMERLTVPPNKYGPSYTTQDDIISKGVLNLTLAINQALRYSKGGPGFEDVVIYSPVGIASALALVLLGSSGKTFQEIASIMGLDQGLDIQSSSETVHETLATLLNRLQSNTNLEYGVKVKIATALFLQTGYPIRPVFQEITKNIYHSDIIPLDFSNPRSRSTEIMNSWVREKTNGKIQEIIGNSPPSYTKVIIASALHFIGLWERPFFEGLTKRRPFHPYGRNDKRTVMADMMSNGGSFPYYRDRNLDCEIMGFPYKGNQTTMYIVMPMDSTKDKLTSLEKRLTSYELERLIKSTSYHKAVILFPKMRLESTVDLSAALKSIGARSLFDRREADLSILSPGINLPSSQINNKNKEDLKEVLIFTRQGGGDELFSSLNPTSSDSIDSLRKLFDANKGKTGRNSENPGLYADQVLHKVYMDITETGTEAAASTSVSLSRGGDSVIFRVDHPFLFFIVDEQTRLALFWGSVSKPTPSYS